MKCRFALLLVLVSLALGLTAGAPQPASAYSWTTPITDLSGPVTNSAEWDAIAQELVSGHTVVPSWEMPGLSEILTGANVVPEVASLPALTTITLGATAFAAGWLIGTGINDHWLHINGAGLGTTGAVSGISGCSSTTGGAVWNFHSNLQSYTSNSHFPASPGWLATVTTGNGYADTIVYDTSSSGGTCAFQSAWQYFPTLPGTQVQLSTGFSPSYSKYMTIAQFNAAFDTPTVPVPYTGSGQPVNISSGWGTGTGTGAGSCTSSGCVDAPAHGTGPSNATCGGACVAIIEDPVFPGLWSGPGSNPRANGTVNALNCSVDPTNWQCPTGDPGTTGTEGGRVGNYTMPSCLGLTVADCETAISAAASGALQTPPSYTELELDIAHAVLTQPAGAVITTSPGASTSVSPGSVTTVTITHNPDPLPILVPQPAPWVLADPTYCDVLTAAGFTCTILVLIDPDPTHGPGEVTHTSLVPGSRQAPGTTVTVWANPATTTAGDPTPYPPGDPNDPGSPSPSPVSSCASCAIDWTPIENISFGTKFPFGGLDWLWTGLTHIIPSGGCPTLYITDPHGGADHGISFCSTAWETDFRPWVFPLMEALMTLMGFAFFVSKLLGSRASNA